MSAAHDVYAELNPAFCAAALVEFSKAYGSVRPEGPEAPAAYVMLPLALSGDLSNTFDGTNKNTGLLEWLERSPQVQIQLADRVNRSIDVVTQAIRFGCFSRLLVLGEGARLLIGEQKLKTSWIGALGDDPGRAIKRAGRLGYWCAQAGSTRTVFDMLGLTA